MIHFLGCIIVLITEVVRTRLLWTLCWRVAARERVG